MKLTKEAAMWLSMVLLGSMVTAEDIFNYRETDGDDYGPEEWDQVECDDVATCVSDC